MTDEMKHELVEALKPFAAVVDALDYFVPEVMPELRFPVAGTEAPDPGYDRSLTEADFRRARAVLAKATGREA